MITPKLATVSAPNTERSEMNYSETNEALGKSSRLHSVYRELVRSVPGKFRTGPTTIKRLTRNECLALFVEMKEGKDRREELICRNIPLVMRMCSKFSERNELHDPGDLFSEGLTALIKAVDKFSVEKGYAFSSYACTAIIREISERHATTSKVISRPRYSLTKTSVLQEAKQKMKDGDDSSIKFGHFRSKPSTLLLSNKIFTSKFLSTSYKKHDEDLMDFPSEPDSNRTGQGQHVTQVDSDDLIEKFEERITQVMKGNTRNVDIFMAMRLPSSRHPPMKATQLSVKYGVSRQRICEIESRTMRMLQKQIGHEVLELAAC